MIAISDVSDGWSPRLRRAIALEHAAAFVGFGGTLPELSRSSDWTQFDTQAVRALLTPVKQRFGSGPFLQHAYRTFCFSLQWLSMGMPTASLTHGATTRFGLTDLRGLRFSEIGMPFPSLFLQMPDKFSGLSLTGKQSKPVPIRSIALSSHSLFDTLGQRREELSIHAVSWDGTSLFSDQPLEADTSLESLCSANWPTTSGDGMIQLEQCDEEALSSCIRVALNACVYMVSCPEKVERLRCTQFHKETALLGVPCPKHWIVGRGITVSSNEAAALSALSSPGRPAWRAHSRFIVRGHWRNQACGLRSETRKRIWIQPHWKGPADAKTAIARLYTIEVDTIH